MLGGTEAGARRRSTASCWSTTRRAPLVDVALDRGRRAQQAAGDGGGAAGAARSSTPSSACATARSVETLDRAELGGGADAAGRSASRCCARRARRRSRDGVTADRRGDGGRAAGPTPSHAVPGSRAQPQDHDARRPRAGPRACSRASAVADGVSAARESAAASTRTGSWRAVPCCLGGVAIAAHARPRGPLRRRLRAARGVRRAARRGRARATWAATSRARDARWHGVASRVFLEEVARLVAAARLRAREPRRHGDRTGARRWPRTSTPMRAAIARAPGAVPVDVGVGQGQEHGRPGRARPRRGHRGPRDACCS